MDFKKFNIQVIIRVLIILSLSLIISYFYFKQERLQLIFTFFVFCSLLIATVIELIWFVNKTNRELSKFIFSIKYSDFSVYFPEERKKGHLSELYSSFNAIIDSFKKLSGEKHLQNELLHLIVSQVKLGIICTNGKNEVVLMNQAAEKVLGVFKTKTWSQLGKKANYFTTSIDELPKGGSQIIEHHTGSSSKQLYIQVNHSKLFDEPHRIITLHDIRNEIEQKETEAWIRLIRILNHEIMNSVTPISSLSETILMILDSENALESGINLSNEKFTDIIRSTKTIQQRSNNLFNFVTEYRKLTRIPNPKKEEVAIKELLVNILHLWEKEFKEHDITTTIEIPDDLTINVDPTLIEQVLINIIKNSIQALENKTQAKISIHSLKTDQKNILFITDNGEGIPESIIKDIFVPFYTTKEKGSGVGLSLSRQIMRMHGGNINILSIPNKETIVSLEF